MNKQNMVNWMLESLNKICRPFNPTHSYFKPLKLSEPSTEKLFPRSYERNMFNSAFCHLGGNGFGYISAKKYNSKDLTQNDYFCMFFNIRILFALLHFI